MERLVSLLIGYVCGNFITGYFYGKLKHVDIRTMGSGNVGTTNTFRSLGWKAGVVTLLGDLLKVGAAILIVWLLYRGNGGVNVRVLMFYAAFGAVLGHNFPIIMKFHGGKGIACTAGLVLILCPVCVPVCLAIFILAVAVTRYVSLGSILVCISFFIQVLIFGHMGLLGVSGSDLVEVTVICGIVAALDIFRHRENIKRLLNGTENKIKFR